MNLLTMENIFKSYGEKILFNFLSFGIDEEEKIGLIGVNGTGKSTLLKIIAGVEFPDQGKVTVGNSVRIEYLPQDPLLDDQATVIQQIFKGDSPVMQLLQEYEGTMEKINYAPDQELLQEKIIALSQQMDILNAWQLESEAKTILTKLGIFDFEAKVGSLSGGQRKRIALAGVLINSADLLILDEPTNHIDNETVGWLEDYLNKRKGALLMVTHDRYFLDRVTNRILELDQGKIQRYIGNYSTFLDKKAEREAEEQAQKQARQNLYRNELAWIQRGARARSTKQKARIERFEKLKEQNIKTTEESLEIPVGSTRLGKKVIEMEQVSRSFGDQKVIDDFSYIFARRDRVGIIGPNGIGKSTLLNLIAGKLSPDQGTIEIGQTVKIGCFSQENQEMDLNRRVIDYIKDQGEYISTFDGKEISASQMLERFLFPPEMQWTTIGRLSGGEKRRLYLLWVLMSEPNVLLLDEPTNDLDIKTLTILEEYLDEFPGLVITVSHDRYFLDKVVDKILAFQGSGTVISLVGNYSRYLDYREAHCTREEKPGENKKENPPKDRHSKDHKTVLKFTFKEQKEYEVIDEIIAGLEEALKNVNEKINQAGSDFELLQDLLARQQELEEQLEEKMERWTYLNELAEEIAREKTKDD